GLRLGRLVGLLRVPVGGRLGRRLRLGLVLLHGLLLLGRLGRRGGVAGLLGLVLVGVHRLDDPVHRLAGLLVFDAAGERHQPPRGQPLAPLLVVVAAHLGPVRHRRLVRALQLVRALALRGRQRRQIVGPSLHRSLSRHEIILQMGETPNPLGNVPKVVSRKRRTLAGGLPPPRRSSRPSGSGPRPPCRRGTPRRHTRSGRTGDSRRGTGPPRPRLPPGTGRTP